MSTYGEARAVDATGADDYGIADDEPYDVQELGFVAYGDWPPNAGILALKKLLADLRERLAPERNMVDHEWAFDRILAESRGKWRFVDRWAS